MGYKVLASMNIAVIGSGNVSEAYAMAFARAGHQSFLACKDGDEVGIDAALASFENISICSIEEAADVADLIVIATHPRDVREVAYWLGDVRRKVIIDATANVYAPDEITKTVCAIKAITGSPHVVKVFNTQGYEQLVKPLFKDDAVSLFFAGDSKKAKEITKIMAMEIGIKAYYDFGGDEAIPLFNELTRSLQRLAIANSKQVPVLQMSVTDSRQNLKL